MNQEAKRLVLALGLLFAFAFAVMLIARILSSPAAGHAARTTKSGLTAAEIHLMEAQQRVEIARTAKREADRRVDFVREGARSAAMQIEKTQAELAHILQTQQLRDKLLEVRKSVQWDAEAWEAQVQDHGITIDGPNESARMANTIDELEMRKPEQELYDSQKSDLLVRQYETDVSRLTGCLQELKNAETAAEKAGQELVRQQLEYDKLTTGSLTTRRP